MAQTIKTHHLRYLVAVIRHRSLRKAAIALGVRQSSISRGLRDLEARIGKELLHRDVTGVRPTHAGVLLNDTATEIFHGLNKCVHHLKGVEPQLKLSIRVGIGIKLSSEFINCLVNNFNQYAPGSQLIFISNPSDIHATNVRKGGLDVAIGVSSAQWRTCEEFHLWNEQVYAILSSRSRRSYLEEVDWAELSRHQLLIGYMGMSRELATFAIERFEARQQRMNIDWGKINSSEMLVLTRRQSGFTLSTKSLSISTYPGVVQRPIKGESISIAAFYSLENTNPLIWLFLDIIKETISFPSDVINMPTH